MSFRTHRVMAAVLGLALGAALPRPAAARDQTPADTGFQQSGCGMTVYTDKAFKGTQWTMGAGYAYVGDEWNGKIASLTVQHGVWRLFSQPDFQGDHEDVAYDTKDVGEKWAGKIGSFLCVQQN